MTRTLLIILMPLLVLVGCTQITTSGLGFPDEVDRYNQAVLEALDSGSPDDLLALFSDDLKASADIEESLEAMQALVQAHPTDFERLTSLTRRVVRNGQETASHQSHWESAYGDGFLTIDLIVKSGADCCEVVNLRTYQDEIRPSTRNDFGTPPLSLVRIVFPLLLIANVAFIVATLVVCVRDTGVVNRKWLWILFILFGLWGVTLNWTTGQLSPNFITANSQTGYYGFDIITFTLLGASVMKSGVYAPWLLEIGLPLGAMLYWLRRRKRRAGPVTEEAAAGR